LTNYENIMAGSDNGPVVIAGDADNSLLVELIVEQEMPKRGPKLTPPQSPTDHRLGQPGRAGQLESNLFSYKACRR
jgi:hypothetical protein